MPFLARGVQPALRDITAGLGKRGTEVREWATCPGGQAGLILLAPGLWASQSETTLHHICVHACEPGDCAQRAGGTGWGWHLGVLTHAVLCPGLLDAGLWLCFSESCAPRWPTWDMWCGPSPGHALLVFFSGQISGSLPVPTPKLPGHPAGPARAHPVVQLEDGWPGAGGSALTCQP